MNKNKTTKPVVKPVKKQAKTIKVSTLVKAAVIVAAVIASFVVGVYAANSYDEMIESHAEQRATALLKSDGK